MVLHRCSAPGTTGGCRASPSCPRPSTPGIPESSGDRGRHRLHVHLLVRHRTRGDRAGCVRFGRHRDPGDHEPGEKGGPRRPGEARPAHRPATSSRTPARRAKEARTSVLLLGQMADEHVVVAHGGVAGEPLGHLFRAPDHGGGRIHPPVAAVEDGLRHPPGARPRRRRRGCPGAARPPPGPGRGPRRPSGRRRPSRPPGRRWPRARRSSRRRGGRPGRWPAGRGRRSTPRAAPAGTGATRTPSTSSPASRRRITSRSLLEHGGPGPSGGAPIAAIWAPPPTAHCSTNGPRARAASVPTCSATSTGFQAGRR